MLALRIGLVGDGLGGVEEGQQQQLGAAAPLGVSNPASCFFKSKSPLCFSTLGYKNRFKL